MNVAPRVTQILIADFIASSGARRAPSADKWCENACKSFNKSPRKVKCLRVGVWAGQGVAKTGKRSSNKGEKSWKGVRPAARVAA